MRLASLVAGIAFALALFGALAGSAWAGWTAPVDVSQTGVVADSPRVAVDGAGDITVVWVSGTSPNRSIRSAYRPAGGSWEASDLRLSSVLDCHDPQLAVNPAGAAVLVADCDAGAALINAEYRPAGGSWGSVESVPTSSSGSGPRVDLDDAGNAILVWEQGGGTVQSSYRPAAGSWGAKAQVSPAPTGSDITSSPDVAISPTGRALAVWLHTLNRPMPPPATDHVVTVETAGKQGSGAWGGIQALTKPATSTDPVTVWGPQVEINAGGRIAVWSQAGEYDPAALRSAWGSGGDFGSWGADFTTRKASDGVRAVEAPQVAIDGQGRAVAVWRSFEPISGSFLPQGATTSFVNDDWSAPVTLSDVFTGGFSGTEPQVAIDPAGDATAIWPVLGGSIYAVQRPAGGAFSTASPVPGASSAGSDPPAVAMDAGGDAFIAWASTEISVALNDATPPVLSAISVPVSAATGTEAAMSASASDAWSPPVTFSWDFGDGSTSTGNAVSHSYASGGTKTVTVTATDAVGNSASQARQIVVTQAPKAGPPLPKVKLNVTVPRQSWEAIGKAGAVRLLCSLDVVGTCKATAILTHAVAGRLGLARAARGKAVLIGSGTVRIARTGHPTKLKVKLTKAALKAIAKATKSVPVKLATTGSAPGRGQQTLNRTLTIHP